MRYSLHCLVPPCSKAFLIIKPIHNCAKWGWGYSLRWSRLVQHSFMITDIRKWQNIGWTALTCLIIIQFAFWSYIIHFKLSLKNELGRVKKSLYMFADVSHRLIICMYFEKRQLFYRYVQSKEFRQLFSLVL